MKYIALLIVVLACSGLSAQDLTYQLVQNTKVPTRVTFNSYTSKDGHVFKVGDKITIGKPANGMNFTYLFYGHGTYFAPFEGLTIRKAGKVREIREIKVYGSNAQGYHAHFRLKVGGVQIEEAIESGEVIVGQE